MLRMTRLREGTDEFEVEEIQPFPSLLKVHSVSPLERAQDQRHDTSLLAKLLQGQSAC